MDFVRQLVPTAIRRRYAVKFGIALVILGISVGLIGYAATAAVTNQVEDRVESDHSSSVSQEAQSLQMWNEQNEHTIGMIVRSDVVASDDSAAIQRRFLDWQEHLDTDTFDISYVNLNSGTVTASTNEAYRGASSNELENVPGNAYSQASQTVPWVSNASTAQGEFGQNTTVITYVQISAENENRAVVYTANLEAYSNQLQDETGVTTMVVDSGNEIMLDNRDSDNSTQTLGVSYGGNESILNAARTKGATTQQVPGSALSFGTDSYNFDNDEYVTSAARVFGTDWVVVSHEPSSQALGYVSNIREWGIVATILGVFMIGTVGVILGRNTTTSIDRLTDKASEMENGNLSVDLETERIDNIGRLYNGFDSMRDALRKQIEEAEAARKEAEHERKRVQELNDHLEDKAAEYGAVMGRAADGDLTARATVDNQNEVMQQIGEDFNEMLDEIEQTIAELNRFATDVATASEQVTASSEEVRSASQQVTGSVQEISDGADRQNDSLQSVNQEMSGLSTTTEEIAASSNEVANIAERTVDTGRDGQEAAQAAIAAMDGIETEAGNTVAEMRRLEKEVQQIDELINRISEIARQTNMLALNANIEASRSQGGGSDDEGFSVVAKEVKALSEDVADAADEAEDRLEAIRDRTEESAAEVEGTSSDIEDASDQVQAAVGALKEITELAQETNVGVQEISAATEEQAATTQEVVSMVDSAATISEETTAEAENVAAAAEEQTTALTEVTKSASNLSQQAAQLSEALDRFDTDVNRADVNLGSSFDGDEELAAGRSKFDVDRPNDQGQGITFGTDVDDGWGDTKDTRDLDDDSEPSDAFELSSGKEIDDADNGSRSTNDAFTDKSRTGSFGSETPASDESSYEAVETPSTDGRDDRPETSTESTDTDAGADPTREFDQVPEQTTDNDDTAALPFDPVDDGEGTTGSSEPGEKEESAAFGDDGDGRNASTGDDADAEDALGRDDVADDGDDSDDGDASWTANEDVFTFGTTTDDE